MFHWESKKSCYYIHFNFLCVHVMVKKKLELTLDLKIHYEQKQKKILLRETCYLPWCEVVTLFFNGKRQTLCWTLCPSSKKTETRDGNQTRVKQGLLDCVVLCWIEKNIIFSSEVLCVYMYTYVWEGNLMQHYLQQTHNKHNISCVAKAILICRSADLAVNSLTPVVWFKNFQKKTKEGDLLVKEYALSQR